MRPRDEALVAVLTLAVFGMMTLILILVGLGTLFRVSEPAAVSEGVTGREESL